MNTPPSDYILTWNGSGGGVLSENIVFKISTPPVLPFPFDTLYYETPTGNAFKLMGGVRHELTAEEIAACKAYCGEYATTAAYPVQAYDPDDGVFLGEMPRPDATTRGLAYRIVEIPDHPASKWVGEKWERIVAVIMEDGSLRQMPGSICAQCALPMTQAEWGAFPKPPKSTYRWDFVEEAWTDPRKLDDLKYEVNLAIRTAFEKERWWAWGKYIPQFEQDTWVYQIEEATAYKANPEAETPYIDAFLAARTDAGKPSKADLCADIIANNHAYKMAVARVNGEQWNWLTRVKTATANAELDAILEELEAWGKSRTRTSRQATAAEA